MSMTEVVLAVVYMSTPESGLAMKFSKSAKVKSRIIEESACPKTVFILKTYLPDS